MTIRGTELPTTDFSVTVGDVSCTEDSINASVTEITCSLSAAPVAGTHSVSMVTSNGKVAIADGTTEIECLVTISMAETADTINRYGGSIITITGTGFGYVKADAHVAITSDGTVCKVMTITGTEITCMTKKMVDIDSCIANAPTLTVTVNGKEAISS